MNVCQPTEEHKSHSLARLEVWQVSPSVSICAIFSQFECFHCLIETVSSWSTVRLRATFESNNCLVESKSFWDPSLEDKWHGWPPLSPHLPFAFHAFAIFLKLNFYPDPSSVIPCQPLLQDCAWHLRMAGAMFSLREFEEEARRSREMLSLQVSFTLSNPCLFSRILLTTSSSFSCCRWRRQKPCWRPTQGRTAAPFWKRSHIIATIVIGIFTQFPSNLYSCPAK